MHDREAFERATAALEVDLGLRPPAEQRARRLPLLQRTLAYVATTVVLLVLPFAVLVRLGTLVYTQYGMPTWIALAVAAGFTVGVVTAYAAVISRKLTGKARIRTMFRRVAVPLVVGYCIYALVYLSAVNAKGPRVRDYYRSLHPALRIAVSTVILADGDIVVTDTRRVPADYAAMGLEAREQSLHYKQTDGYVHALDLRTLGRPGWKNRLVQGYFELMGFRTLRHRGTEDHLHVSLPAR